ncbi:MAG TPA: 50S ribosomal protein L21, partial [Nocardioides sp.]
GKQEKVEAGQVLNVEKLGKEIDDVVEFTPVMLVDGDTVLATPSQLAGATVTAKVVGETKGPKINGFTYKNKSNQRKRWGHRQHYNAIEITGISKG